MSNYLISMPANPFSMPRQFKAVANGKIWIGQPDTDPSNSANQIPVYIVNENGTEVQVAQPILINAGGFPVYNGQVAKFVTKQNYSMAVYDSFNSLQYYWEDVSTVDPAMLSQVLLSGPFDERGGNLGLRNIVTVSDFNGVSGFDHDSKDALTAFINHINSGVNDNAIFLVDGLYKTTADLPAITRPVHLTGTTAANSAILFSGLNKGLLFDFRNLSGEKNPGTVFSKLAILTDTVTSGSAIQLRAETLGNTRMVRFWGDEFQIDSLTRFMANAGRSSQEWKCGFEIGDVTDTAKGFHSVRLTNFNIYGADNNDLYSTLTSTGSDGIVVRNSSGLFVEKAKVYLLSGTGIKTVGQCEGTIINNSEIVATRGGVHVSSPVNPSNNHSITQTHISPYEFGVKIDGAASDSATPVGNYIESLFILERDTEVVKSGGFTGVECMGKISTISNVWVYSGVGSPNGSTAFVLGRAGNILSNCFARRQTYVIKVVDHPWATNLVPMINGLWSDGIGGRFIHPSTSVIPTGLMADSVDKLGFGSINWNRPTFACSSFSIMDRNSERKMYDFSDGTMYLKSSSPLGTTQISHRNSDSDIDYTQIQSSGGTSGVANSGRLTLKATAGINVRGNCVPETTNAWSCGAASQAWSGGFTQTAFTITSDERAKTEPLAISDAVMDAWAEVDWRQYKLLERVALKGDAARWHHGVIAQRVVEAFSRHGLDACDYGLLCYDEWEAQEEVVRLHEATPDLFDEHGELVQPGMDAYTEIASPARPAGSGYSIRYEEAFALESELHRRNYDRLLAKHEAMAARVEKLENLISKAD